MRALFSFLAGLVFSIGLVIADMTNPAKIANFLDVAGSWDASLIFVMGGASVVAFFGFRMVQARQRPLFGERFVLPDATRIDGRLIGGSMLFGVGWGLSGFCPGPAIAGLVWGRWETALFVAMMAAGMIAADWMLGQSDTGNGQHQAAG
ncbi:MAG: DUF6691 family protein [Alphaproteobacteria bacterium]